MRDVTKKTDEIKNETMNIDGEDPEIAATSKDDKVAMEVVKLCSHHESRI
jgi:hypothetical protein